jgi:tetratricopeptide (TPR) repeat protein
MSEDRDIAPSDFEACKQLGIALATRGDWAAAKDPLGKAAALDDRDPVVFNVISACAFETGDYAGALAAADRALALQPFYPEAHNNRGNALLRLDRPGEAAEALKTALKLTPRDPEAHLNLANALDALDRVPAALQLIDRAIALDPRLVPAHVNRGNILQRLSLHREALEAYDRAIALDPRDFDANWNRAMCHLLLGDYEAGWAGYEWRWRLAARKAQAVRFSQPLWLGQESLEGRTILVHSEQGFGDVIQFVRYLPRLAERGGRVVFEAFPPLEPLMAGLPGADQVVRRDEALPPFDLHCPLLSLPLALGEPAPLAFTGHYLKADPGRAAAWADRLGPRRGPRVGLVASGSRTHRKDALRSIPFETLMAALPAGPEYHLLQKDVREADRAALSARPDVAIWDEALGDFGDTAALCDLMDVVVSVDTSVAHLAGALGRPVSVLLPVEPDWRWGLDSQTTPWYPQMRLYRQTVLRDWSDPLDRLALDLAALL